MISKWFTALLVVTILASGGVRVGADESVSADQPVEKIIVPTIVQPNELRSYRLSVAIKGCVGVLDGQPLLVDAVNTMKVLHQYGRREGDGLLQLDISAIDVKATINGEQAPAAVDQFPKLTLLLDKAWNIYRIFGIDGTRYAGQVPGLNYGNLAMLFHVPDIGKGHALGKAWKSSVRLPGRKDEIKISSTVKSRDVEAKTVTLRQEYAWAEMKVDADRSVKSTAVVDSTFDLVTGKLLRSHAECQLPFSEPSQQKPENRHYSAISKIDISLEK